VDRVAERYQAPKTGVPAGGNAPFRGKEPRVAIVHDWFVTYAGAERVVEQMLKLWPQADLFALVDFLPDKERAFLGGRRVHTSFIQRLPRAGTSFRNYLLLMPLAVEQFDLSSYDVVISSSHAVAKGAITGPRQVHVSYVHTPIRYAWDLQNQYLTETGLNDGVKGWIVKLGLHYMRLWDTRTANGVDAFVANSRYIARRIRKAYGRKSRVIYPPVDIGRFAMRTNKDSFYLAASRMVPYKRMAMIAQAFATMPDRQLVVIGDGPDFESVKSIGAAAPNIQVLGYQSADVLSDYMGRARAFVFAAEEDFGIAPVEAQACGTPVIAYAAGGALETVVASNDVKVRTGLFFNEATVAGVCSGVRAFEAAGEFDPYVCRAQAERFSVDTFRSAISAALNAAMISAEDCGQTMTAGKTSVRGTAVRYGRASGNHSDPETGQKQLSVG
jgi:glycosyltransferase involved in cell wall biosynthesis